MVSGLLRLGAPRSPMPALLLAAFLLSGGLGCRAREPAPATIVWQGDILVRKAGEWRLEIAYLHKGTRSEGQHGELYLKDESVPPDKADDKALDTPFGKLKHYGAQRKRLWDTTGWNFADPKAIQPSGNVNTSAKPEAAD